jgi:hypothetical protein
VTHDPELGSDAVLRTELLFDIRAHRAKHFAWGYSLDGDLRTMAPGDLALKAMRELEIAIFVLQSRPTVRAYARDLMLNTIAFLIAEIDRLDAEEVDEATDNRNCRIDDGPDDD